MSSSYKELVYEFGTYAFFKGLNYDSNSVKLINIEDDEEMRTVKFKVKSERVQVNYDVQITINLEKRNFFDMHCNCPQFRKEGVCKHLAASAIKYYDELFDTENYHKSDKYNLLISQNIINSFYKPKVNKIRKKLNLEITLNSFDSWYYDSYLQVTYRIGENKLYSTNGKFSKFLNAYKSGEAYKMTQKFTYQNDEYYFNEIDKQILDYSYNKLRNCHEYYGDRIVGSQIDDFMELLKNKKIYIENEGLFDGIVDENPFDIELSKKDNNYLLQFKNIDNFKPLIQGHNYIYDDKNLYKLPEEITKLYNLMDENEISMITFTKENLERFSNGLLGLIKDNVRIDESAKEVVIIDKPVAKLYFDFYYNAIECQVKILYGKKEINLFDDVPEVVRNQEYENMIFEKLDEYNFVSNSEKSHFILDDIDDIGYFLEKGLAEISEIYEVFTSQKIKDTNITKDTKAQVNFSIGTDNIMSYDFELSGIDNSEISSVLDSLHAKKKYYKLKSGAILNLENNDNLQQFDNLMQDMELSDKDIDSASGEVPKYRAIYFDSLKNNRYKDVISTNNLFDELINKFNSFKDNDIDLSKKDLSILRDYQTVGVKWLYNIYKCGFGGILADEMGLGKSIQLIYLIKLIVKENPKAKILIVAPTSLIYNWKKEFDKFGSELKYKVFAENKEKRLNDLDNVDDLNVLITTYGLVRNDVAKYSQMSFDLIAIDEAQNIKNPNVQMTKIIKSLKSNVKIALTGTPLENSVMELWSIFDFIMPGYLASYKKFQSLYNIKDVDQESLNRLDTLNMQITYFILRRKKKDVVKELPDKIENNIYVDLGQVQKKLYVAEVQKTKKEMDELMRTEGFTKARFKILQLLTKLRQICIDPSIAFDNYNGGRAKIEELIKIVEETKANGHKMLIFTTYKTALDIVVKELNNAGISSYYIDGSVSSKKRMELVEKFNTDDTDVFIITLKAGGTGLNLTAATVVIHLDLWWNPQVENQATDRAHRIGQKETVEVIRLIAKGTIEERILELQTKKRKLADALIEGDMRSENQFSKLTEKEIQMLLSMDNTDDVLL